MASEIPSSVFSPVSKAGLLLWMRTHQVVLIGLSLGWIVMGVLRQAPLLSVSNVVAVAVIAVSVPVVHSRSLWQWAGILLGFAAAQATGNTQWTISPMAAGTVTALIDLPGAAGKRLKPLTVKGTRFDGGAIVEDKNDGTYTVSLQADACDWLLTPSQEQAARAGGYARLVQQACQIQGVTSLTVQSRFLPRPVGESGGATGGVMGRDLSQVRDSLDGKRRFDTIVSITFDRNSVHSQARAQGGLNQVQHVIASHVMQVASLLPTAGIRRGSVRWLDTAQLRGAIKTLTDPSAVNLLDEKGRLSDDVPMSTHYRVWADKVHIDAVWASSMWVERWPDVTVMAGWLNAVTASPDVSIIVSQAYRAVPYRQAARDIDARMAELDNVKHINRILRRPTSQAVLDETGRLKTRRSQLETEQVGMRMRGFITLLADSPEHLAVAQQSLQRSCGSLIHVDKLSGQQWAGWLTALPLGQSGRS